MADIHVFICADNELTKKLVRDHFNKTQITAAYSFDESQREIITKALDAIL